jgi:hypothetical protein
MVLKKKSMAFFSSLTWQKNQDEYLLVLESYTNLLEIVSAAVEAVLNNTQIPEYRSNLLQESKKILPFLEKTFEGLLGPVQNSQNTTFLQSALTGLYALYPLYRIQPTIIEKLLTVSFNLLTYKGEILREPPGSIGHDVIMLRRKSVYGLLQLIQHNPTGFFVKI